MYVCLKIGAKRGLRIAESGLRGGWFAEVQELAEGGAVEQCDMFLRWDAAGGGPLVDFCGEFSIGEVSAGDFEAFFAPESIFAGDDSSERGGCVCGRADAAGEFGGESGANCGE